MTIKQRVVGFIVGGLSGVIPGIIGATAVLLPAVTILYTGTVGSANMVLAIPILGSSNGFIGGAIGGVVYPYKAHGFIGGTIGGLVLSSLVASRVYS